MKILWLSHVIPYPPKGGLWQRSYNLLKQMGSKHDVHLVTLNQKKLYSSQDSISDAVVALKKVCNRVDVFPIKSDKSKWNWAFMTFKNYFNNIPYDVNWLRNKDMVDYMKDVLLNTKYDLIHLDTFGLFPYTFLIKNAKIVLNHHNIESNMMRLRYEKEKSLYKKIYFNKEAQKIEAYEKYICRKCAMNLVVSELDAIRLKEIVGNANIAVVRNGVDLKYYQSNNNDKIKSGLIFAGGMGYYANREAAIFFASEVWPLLENKNYCNPITFIGRNPPKELMDLSHGSSVQVPGFVDDVRPYFNSSKIYICPIKNGGGTRLKIIDALAMEKPLVATGLAVEGLNLVEGLHYLRAESASDFVDQIMKLENDDKLCETLATAGRKYVEENYSWEIIGNQMDEAYQKAINI